MAPASLGSFHFIPSFMHSFIHSFIHSYCVCWPLLYAGHCPWPRAPLNEEEEKETSAGGVHS